MIENTSENEHSTSLPANTASSESTCENTVPPLPHLTKGKDSVTNANQSNPVLNELMEDLGGVFATLCIIGGLYLTNPGIFGQQITLVLLAWLCGISLFVSLKYLVKWLKQRKENDSR